MLEAHKMNENMTGGKIRGENESNELFFLFSHFYTYLGIVICIDKYRQVTPHLTSNFI